MLQPLVKDNFRWRWTSCSEFSSSSAYQALFIGQTATPGPVSCGRRRHQTSAASLYGCACMVTFGRRNIGVAIVCSLRTPVSCALNSCNHWIISSFDVSSAARCGSKLYVPLDGTTLRRHTLSPSSTGGLALDGACPSLTAQLSTPLSSSSRGTFGLNVMLGLSSVPISSLVAHFFPGSPLYPLYLVCVL